MGQMLSGLTGGSGGSPGALPDMSVGYSMDVPGGATGSTAVGGGPAPTDPSMGQPQGMSQLADAYAGMQHLNNMAMSMGDTPQERTANARAFASLVDQLGKMGDQINKSTILQRLMKGRIRPIAAMGAGQASGGVAGIPATFQPQVAQSIMSQMGYR